MDKALTALSVAEASPNSSSIFEAMEEKESSRVNSLPKESSQTRTRCCGLSARAARGLEVAVLAIVVVCVMALLSLPSAFHIARLVSGCKVVSRKNTVE